MINKQFVQKLNALSCGHELKAPRHNDNRKTHRQFSHPFFQRQIAGHDKETDTCFHYVLSRHDKQHVLSSIVYVNL